MESSSRHFVTMEIRFIVLNFAVLYFWNSAFVVHAVCRHRPNNCDFERDLCDWNDFEGTYPNLKSAEGKTWLELEDHVILRSNDGCRTNSEHCFQLDYKFLPYSNHYLILSVYVKTIEWNSEDLVANRSVSSNVSTEWKQFQIAFKSNTNLRIYIDVHSNNRHQQGGTVLIDSLNYTESPCPTFSTLPTTTTATTMTTTTVITTQVPASDHEESQSTTLSSDGATQSTNPPLPTSSSHTAESVDNKGIIIGSVTVVVVLIIVCIGVVVFLKRRKHICFKAKRNGRTEHFGMNNAAEFNGRASHNPTSYSASQQLPSDGLYSIAGPVDSSNSPSGQSVEYAKVNKQPALYAKVNKQRSKGNVPKNNLYENVDCAEHLKPNHYPGIEYNHLNFSKRSANVVEPATGATHGSVSPELPPNADDDYNALDFDGKKTFKKSVSEREESNTVYNRMNEGERVSRKSVSEKGESNVYNHLNEGDGDTYSEVDREGKTESIHDEYSHIPQ